MVYEFQYQGRTYRLTMECTSEPSPPETLASLLHAALLPEAPRYTPKPCRMAAVDGQVVSPLPGTVVRICAKSGEPVKAGALLVVVEAMKMENELRAPFDGVVESIAVQPGENIHAGQLVACVGGALE